MKSIEELKNIESKYNHLKKKTDSLGLKVRELKEENEKLHSQMNKLKKMIKEQFFINDTVINLNLKIYELQQKIKNKNNIIRHKQTLVDDATNEMFNKLLN